jgi:hypothetical protein
MKEIIEQLTMFRSKIDEKNQKKLGINHIINLSQKMEDKEDEIVDGLFKSLVEQLNNMEFSDKNRNKSYYEDYKQLKKHVKEKYGLIPKGSIQEEYLSYGIVFGLLIGSAFIAINPAFIAIGLPIGVALGLSLGTNKEKKLEDEDKLY